MDKLQETNLRLTLVVKSIEAHHGFDSMGFKDIREALDWIIAPSKQTIIPAKAVE